MTFFAHGGISKKKSLWDLYYYSKWNFKPKISSIFHFEYVKRSMNTATFIIHLYCIKYLDHFQVAVNQALLWWHKYSCSSSIHEISFKGAIIVRPLLIKTSKIITGFKGHFQAFCTTAIRWTGNPFHFWGVAVGS